MVQRIFRCVQCKREVSDASSAVFTFEDLMVNLARNPFTCIECRKAMFAGLFYKCAGLLMPDVARGVRINWPIYVRAWHTAQDDDGELVTDMTNLLLLIGVLSGSLAGNWTVKDGINPHDLSGLTVYFTNREDVITYAALMCGNTQYHWSVVQHGEVIGKLDVIAAYKAQTESYQGRGTSET